MNIDKNPDGTMTRESYQGLIDALAKANGEDLINIISRALSERWYVTETNLLTDEQSRFGFDSNTRWEFVIPQLPGKEGLHGDTPARDVRIEMTVIPHSRTPGTQD